MLRKLILFTWIFFLFGAASAAQQAEGLIEDIFLIKNPNEQLLNPPDQIRIRIDMAAPAYYKLLKERQILSAGIFPAGHNSLSIPTESFFEKTAKHTFALELKTEQGIFRTNIIFDIQMAVMEAPKKDEPEMHISEHKLSLYIEDQLVSSRIKQLEKTIPVEMELPPLPKNYDPFKPDQNDNFMSNSASILDALGLAYHLIKSATKKKDPGEQAQPLQYSHSMAVKFIKKNSKGVEEEVIAMIGLTTK